MRWLAIFLGTLVGVLLLAAVGVIGSDTGLSSMAAGFCAGFLGYLCFLGHLVQGAEEFAGAGDGGVGALHGFNGDAGAGRDDDGLTEITGGDAAVDGAALVDVLEFMRAGLAGGEGAHPGEQRLEVCGGADEPQCAGQKHGFHLGDFRLLRHHGAGTYPVWLGIR